jgi:hypothetical protein
MPSDDWCSPSITVAKVYKRFDMGKQRHDYFAHILTLLLGAGEKVEFTCQVFSLFFAFKPIAGWFLFLGQDH